MLRCIVAVALPFCQGVPVTLKSLRQRYFSGIPQTLGEHLKKRRKELGLLQREAATQMGISRKTCTSWEKDKTTPMAANFRMVVVFLGYDPTPKPKPVADRMYAPARRPGT
jgi:DNA-binding XRE family transcriptional regulator